MENVHTTLSFLVSAFSIGLAVSALVIAWLSFASTTKTLTEAQKTLAEISQKVEVVVRFTAEQLGKTLNHIISLPARIPVLSPDEADRKEKELIEKAKQEARGEAEAAVSKAGLTGETKENLLFLLEPVLNKHAERTRALVEQGELVELGSALETEIRGLGRKMGEHFSDDISLSKLADQSSHLLGGTEISKVLSRVAAALDLIEQGVEMRLADLQARVREGDALVRLLGTMRLGHPREIADLMMSFIEEYCKPPDYPRT